MPGELFKLVGSFVIFFLLLSLAWLAMGGGGVVLQALAVVAVLGGLVWWVDKVWWR